MDALHNTNAKLLAFDFLSLTPTAFHRKGKLLLTHAKTVGVFTSRELIPNKFLKFYVDDGTGCIPCVLWLNHLTSPYFSRRIPPDVRRIADMASCFASQIQLGVVARVRGRITAYRGSVQISIQLARKCYDALNLSPHDPNRSS